MPLKLLAKSPKRDVEIDLFQHSRDCAKAAEYLFGTSKNLTRLGRAWLRFFQISDTDIFIRTLQGACICHDLGKATNGFQRVVRRAGEQLVRHEHISALILYHDALRDSLDQDQSLDYGVLLAAVGSHHLKSNFKEFAAYRILSNNPVEIYTCAPEFKSILELASEKLQIQLPHFGDNLTWGKDYINEIARNLKKYAKDSWQANHDDDSLRRLLAAVKAALISSDAISSASIRENLSLKDWLDSCFGINPITEEWVNDMIISPRISEIQKRTGKSFQWRDFQLAVGDLGDKPLLISSCGSGKTLAAWKWFGSRAKHRDFSRLIFLYPTRATATEGFRDYVSWAGGDVAALQHGTSEFDLKDMFDNGEDSRSKMNYQIPLRLFALGYWPKRVFSATVDSFLAFMRNRYTSLCMLPVLSDSAIVVDEVHSFDRKMFTALERFINFFDIPVLCMTATLTGYRRSILIDHCQLQAFPEREKDYEDLQRQSTIPRYSLRKIPNCEEATNYIKQVFDRPLEGKVKKVMWVVNTVSRCQALHRSLILPEVSKLCYHSRFRLQDRKIRHQEVIDCFKKHPGPLLLITTQVCEMSLDLDADILVTELAPVCSLIQRMGRCCREPIPSSSRIGEILFYEPPGINPYEREEIDEAAHFCDEMISLQAARDQEALSQFDLAKYLEDNDLENPLARDGYVGFLDSGMFASGSEEAFREGDDYTVDAIIDTDVDLFMKMKHGSNPEAVGLILPVPRRFARQDNRLSRYLHTAPVSHYHPDFGFCNEELIHE